MIPSEKDRLECLKLAVSLVIPRHNIGQEKLAETVLQTAQQFFAFISKTEDAK